MNDPTPLRISPSVRRDTRSEGTAMPHESISPARLCRRVLAGVLTAILAMPVLMSNGTPAAAFVVPPVVAPTGQHVTADALPTVQINGVVWDQHIIGNTVYVAGDFSQARPAGSAAGVNETARANMLA